MAAFQIYDMADRPWHIETISRWMWDEWDQARGWSLEQSIKETETWCQRDAIPWGIVAYEEDKLLGVMCLLPYDLDDRLDLSPWMACQYVIPEARGHNIAMSLSLALEERARRLNFQKIYMWTEHNPSIYSRYGYKQEFSRLWHGRTIVVLAKELQNISRHH